MTFMKIKKVFLIFFSILSLCCKADWHADLVYGIYDKMGYCISEAKWAPVNLSVFPCNLMTYQTDIYGIRVVCSPFYGNNKVCGMTAGVSHVAGEHYGVAGTVLYSAIGVNYGISVSPVNLSIENHGVQVGAFNIILPLGDTVNYVQIGVFNHAENGLQIGLLNHNPNALIPWMPFFNYSSHYEGGQR